MSDIADPALAEAGRTRIEWADAQMPVLRSLRERFATSCPLEGLTVAACLHVTAETAGLVRALVAGGRRGGRRARGGCVVEGPAGDGGRSLASLRRGANVNPPDRFRDGGAEQGIEQ